MEISKFSLVKYPKTNTRIQNQIIQMVTKAISLSTGRKKEQLLAMYKKSHFSWIIHTNSMIYETIL